MYHPVSIDGLTNAQINKLLAGHPVRVKHGKHHKIGLSAEQYKKHVRAHTKGKGMTLQFDPYQQALHRNLKGCGIMSSLKKAYGHAKSAYGQAKSAIGHASKFYGEHKETLEPYGSILKKQAHHKVEHVAQKAQPHLSKHLGEFGTHLGSHASRVAHENIESFGELPPEEQQLLVEEHELEGMGFRRHRGGKINVGKLLSKAGNMAGSGAKSYLKSDAGRQLVNKGISAGLTGLAGATGQPEFLMAQPMVSSMADRAISGLGVRRRGRPRKLIRGSALYAAGYSSY